MDEDFPCSHSMDTHWYAVDPTGHVGLFISGENGHAPEEASDEYVVDELWRLHHGSGADEALDEAIANGAYDQLAGELGLFVYDYDDGFDPISPYSRTQSPEAPLHVDQLPPELRKLCKQIRFTKVDFAESGSIQPLEHFICAYWYKDNRVAYLCADGKTVRPVPGMEARFPEFCREFRKLAPGRAKGLYFEGLEDEPADEPKPKAKPRRKRKDNQDGR